VQISHYVPRLWEELKEQAGEKNEARGNWSRSDDGGVTRFLTARLSAPKRLYSAANEYPQGFVSVKI